MRIVSHLPTFRSGMGALTADVLNALVDSQEATKIEPWQNPEQPNSWTGPTVCRVVSSTAITGNINRWLYELETVSFTDYVTASHVTNTWTTSSGSEPANRAVNLAEFCNTSTNIQGQPVSNLPTGFALAPIANDTFVMAWKAPAPGSVATGVIVFSLQNVIQGTC